MPLCLSKSVDEWTGGSTPGSNAGSSGASRGTEPPAALTKMGYVVCQWSHVWHMMQLSSQRTHWADRAAPLQVTWRFLRKTGPRRQERGGRSLSVSQHVAAPAKKQATLAMKATTARVQVLPQIPSCRPQQLVSVGTARPTQSSRHWPYSVTSLRSKTMPSLGSPRAMVWPSPRLLPSP
jgi:hypothetical protein